MRITNQRISQIIKEELARSRRMNEMMDGPYNDDLQNRHGQFTSPQFVKGTPQYAAANAPPHSPEPVGRPYVSRRSEWGDDDLFGGPPRVDEADDDMETDGDDMTDIDVVADDAPGDDDMAAAEMEAEIDWSQFDDDDADAVGAAFLEAVKLLREEMPEETPTATAVVERMQEILAGGDEADDNAFMDTPAPEAPLAEGVDWRRRAGLLAGITKRY